MFETKSKIKIGTFTGYGVNDVQIKKSLLTYINTGYIKLPARARVQKKGTKGNAKIIDTASQFKEGDEVSVWLGYDDDLRLEFKGFVRRVNKTRPCQIELEGYSWQLRNKTNVNKFWAKTTVKEIMTEAIKGTDIKLKVADDMEVINYMAKNVSGAVVLEDIIEKVSGKGLTAFFIDNDTLYIGLKYTEYRKTVKYKIGWNIINDDELKERLVDKTNIKIEFVHKSTKGKRVRGQAATHAIGQVKKKTLTSIANASDLKKLAEARLNREAFNGFEGSLTAFLQPYAEPGDKCDLIDPYFNRSGGFIIDSTTVQLNRSGGRRTFGISLKV